ncbi:hypothetical protein MB46_19805 (plasmid) [Arthrobacter alpinus]|nr:hypothetical protein MB46_19805 [Arthrobacter alpinus]
MIVLAGLFVGPPASAAEAANDTANQASSSTITSQPATFGTVIAVQSSDSTSASSANIVSPREPAGKYYYNCVNTNGTSYFVPAGADLSTCKGSYLQTYINGVQIRVASLTTAGALANPAAITMDCAVAVVGAAILVVTAEFSWVYVASAAIGGYGLKSCKA